MKNYRIVSGTPRSGTSVNMRIHGTQFELQGKKFPRLPNEGASEFTRYLKEKQLAKSGDGKQLNPEGFFEDGRYCMSGIHNSVRCSPLPKEGACIKIIGRGLKTTDPGLLSSVLYSLRHPFEAAEAQTDLRNSPKAKPRYWSQDLLSLAAFIKHADVPVFISSYTKLCEKPKEALKDYSDFYGKDFSGAISLLEGHKARPTPEFKGQEWDAALEAYHLALKEDWGGVRQALTKELDTTIKPCPRLGSDVSMAQCKDCAKGEPKILKLFKKRAERGKVNWDQEPCRVDCETMTVEQSIKQNHWR